MQSKSIFHKIFFIFFVTTLFLGCAIQDTTTSTLYIKKYCVGKGGGFTGNYLEFSFSEDGKVYKRDFVYERDVYYKDLSAQDLSYFVEQIKSLGLESAELNSPGNISKYFEIRERETTINKLIWDGGYNNAPQKINNFHDELYKKLSELPE
ncbi:MAG: hypothetical protein KDD29_07430 [Flavobacteriales bacterium]|nr:hypothetical protein [Flavobacteriales bacterium]MCB9335351.1 hypothetical protein [Flavobacteriales bacterium]